MPDIAIDPAAVTSASTRLISAGERRITVPGAGGASDCGAPLLAAVVAEFEQELASYTSLLGDAIAGIGHCATSATTDMESAENEALRLVSRLHAELSGISTTATPPAAMGKKNASSYFKPGYLESIM
jgi:hypothetical protein